jgi:hypothetical protein
MSIHTPTQRLGLMRLPMLAVASTLLVIGFAAGQATPNLAAAIGSALDSARVQENAPALTRADDYATRHAADTPPLTGRDDYATRHRADVPALTQDDDYGTRNR